MHDSLRIVVAQKNVAVRSSDVDDFVTPHVGATIADSANAVATPHAPVFWYVALNLASRYRAQPETQCSNLETVAKKTVPKTAPCGGDNCEAHEHDDAHGDAHGRYWHNHGGDERPENGWQEQQDHRSASVRFFDH